LWVAKNRHSWLGDFRLKARLWERIENVLHPFGQSVFDWLPRSEAGIFLNANSCYPLFMASLRFSSGIFSMA
jgi:hypothetical protein